MATMFPKFPVAYYEPIPACVLPEPYCLFHDELGWLDEPVIECVYPGVLPFLKEEYETFKIKLAAQVKHRVLLKSLEGDDLAIARATVLERAGKITW